MPMSTGQRVKTTQNETGVIVAVGPEPYDWWVDIEFTAKGENRICRVPFYERELEVI